jgi:phage terminase large subunit-like protein
MPVRAEGSLTSGLRSISQRLLEAPVPRAKLEPLPYQIAPEWTDDSWDTWLLLAGRGTGKTLAASYWLNRWMSEHRGWKARIIAPTVGDARESCVLGATGLLAVNPEIRWRINEQSVVWPNGSRARLFGAYTPEDVERLRAGTNSHLDWLEELAAWQKLEDVYIQASFGLRMGRHPRTIVTTTPKPRERLKKLIADPRTRITRATTRDNPFLPEQVRQRLLEEYEGTRLGRQELDAEMLDDIEGALWYSSLIDPYRVHEPPELLKTVVAVDPAKSAQRKSDETGIVVVGRGIDDHGYVIADLSGKYSPKGWAERAIWALDHYSASHIVAETNIAGELVEQVIHDVDKTVMVRGARSRQAKHGRAFPCLGLYEQHRVHHCGIHTALEDQMYAFTGSGDSDEKDDRVDALVLGIHELALVRSVPDRGGWRVYA